MTVLSRWQKKVNFKVSFLRRSRQAGSLEYFLSGVTKEEHFLINDLSVGSRATVATHHLLTFGMLDGRRQKGTRQKIPS